jgi:CRP/FNR family transcriptional regulator
MPARWDPECLDQCPIRGVCLDRNRGFPVREVARGETLFEAGEPLRSFYMVLWGGFKTEVELENQEVQIVELSLRGDMLGTGAMENREHRMTATALTDSRVCVIPAGRRDTDRMARPLVQVLGQRMRDLQWNSARMRSQSAEQGVIALLLRVAAAGSGPGGEFRLPFSRGEMGNYLGLAVETVSRVLQRLQREGLLTISGRHLWLQDPSGLWARLRAPAHH